VTYGMRENNCVRSCRVMTLLAPPNTSVLSGRLALRPGPHVEERTALGVQRLGIREHIILIVLEPTRPISAPRHRREWRAIASANRTDVSRCLTCFRRLVYAQSFTIAQSPIQES
jgi:hypothetical protein